MTPGGRKLVLAIFIGTSALAMAAMLAFAIYVRSASQDYRCGLTLKKIYYAIRDYQFDENGAYPPDLTILVKKGYLLTDNLRPTTDTAAHLYVRPAAEQPIRPDQIIAVEPFANHSGGTHVLRANGDVEWIPKKQAEAMSLQGSSVSEGPE